MHFALLSLIVALCASTCAQAPPQYSSSFGGWRPLLNSIFYRQPRHAHPPPSHSRGPVHAHARPLGAPPAEVFQTAATAYQPHGGPGAYYGRNSFSHPFSHYGSRQQGPPRHQAYHHQVPEFRPIPSAHVVTRGPPPSASAPVYSSYQNQPIYVTAAPQLSYTAMPFMNFVPATATVAPAPVEPIPARGQPLDFVPASQEPPRPSFNFDRGQDAVVTTATQQRYQSEQQISSESLTPESDRNRYHEYEREILGNVQSLTRPHVESQTDIDSQGVEPEPERPRLTPQNIRLVYHDGADEAEVRMTLLEKSRTANEDATFIRAPEISVHQKQRVVLPPPPQPVVYILLRKPVITSEVKYERQEADKDKKPKVFISYEDVSKVISKHIDLETGKIKDHGPEERARQ